MHQVTFALAAALVASPAFAQNVEISTPGASISVHIDAPPPGPGRAVEVSQEPEAGSSSTVAPTPANDLDAVVKAIEAEGFSEQQLGVLSSAAADRWFSVAQVTRLLEIFPFGKDKLKALAITAPRLVDRQNAFKLIGAFSFDAEKDQARRILK